MITIYIDNQPYEIYEGQNLLQACLTLGFDIPHFCWHPALNSVGACRLCAVKVFQNEADTKGKLVMSCLTPASKGIRLSINDPEARKFRAANIEWLMTNHPHDCPVCDEGGECHLQDMTVMTGHVHRQYRFLKRTHRNQYLGPFVNHEMNRCIQCYRCVRFYRDYAGGRDLNVFASHNSVYFGRQQDGVLESEFGGNLVEVCPTGVFTDKTFQRHYVRKWDLQTAPSVCIHCGVGCNTIAGEREEILRRIRNRYNPEVNGFFLCDRGRFGYEFVNHAKRIRTPLTSNGDSPEIKGFQEINRTQSQHLLSSIFTSPGTDIIGIGSPRASLEANFALRTFVGAENFFSGLGMRDLRMIRLIHDILTKGPTRVPSLADVEHADAVFILGEDVPNTAPRLALALRRTLREEPLDIARKLKIPEWDDAAIREAIQDRRGPLFIATPFSTRIDDLAVFTVHAKPEELAGLGFAVAHAVHSNSPANSPADSSATSNQASEMAEYAETIAEALKQARNPLIISGTALRDEAVIQAAANIAWALTAAGKKASLYYCLPECNSMGLAFIEGRPLEEAAQALEKMSSAAILIMENDLLRRMDETLVNHLRKAAHYWIVLDQVRNSTTALSDLVLPAATFAEGSGTVISAEGRAQRYYSVIAPENDVRESWRWIRDIMEIVKDYRASAWHNLDAVFTDMAEKIPSLKELNNFLPGADFRINRRKIPRQTHRVSGRTAITAHLNVHEPKPPGDPDSPLAFSMEGTEIEPPPPFIPRYWAPGWNSMQAIYKYYHPAGNLPGDDQFGKRLLEPGNTAPPGFFTPPSMGKETHKDKILFIPVYHVFGSEELSALAPGIAELNPEPYIALNPSDARQYGLADAKQAGIILADLEISLSLRLDPSIPLGMAGIYTEFSGIPDAILPAWGTLVSDEKSEARK